MTSELILILRDFFPAAEAAGAENAPPRLPALETLLACAARQFLPDGWRAALAARFASPEIAALSPAAAAARAWLDSPAQPGLQYWFATPVHLFAGLDSVHLHPAGLLRLSDSAQSALASEFKSVFGDAPWALHSIGRRELLLAGPPLAASALDPAQFAGGDPGGGLPRGTDAATLRRLGVEIEMWLHQHRINLERARNGELPVSALWLWGALAAARTPSPAADATIRGGHLYGEDAYAEALWRLQSAPSEPLPEHFEALDRRGGGIHVVLYPTLTDDGRSRALQRLEQRWLAPALSALHARRIAMVELLAGTRCYRLRWWQLARFWRARSAWWEQLA